MPTSVVTPAAASGPDSDTFFRICSRERLGQARDAELLETVEQLHHPGVLLFRHRCEDLLDALVGAEVGRAAAPEPVRGRARARMLGTTVSQTALRTARCDFGQLTHLASPPRIVLVVRYSIASTGSENSISASSVVISRP